MRSRNDVNSVNVTTWTSTKREPSGPIKLTGTGTGTGVYISCPSPVTFPLMYKTEKIMRTNVVFSPDLSKLKAKMTSFDFNKKLEGNDKLIREFQKEFAV